MLTAEQIDFLATSDFQGAPEYGWTRKATHYGYRDKVAMQLVSDGILETGRGDRVYLTEAGVTAREEARAKWIAARRVA